MQSHDQHCFSQNNMQGKQSLQAGGCEFFHGG
jgi:hypothetical protein